LTGIDALPQRFATTGPGTGGRIKVRAEDFLVEEIGLYEPCGEGEHLYIGIQKSGVAHGELLSVIRRAFGVSPSAIGYAGMKDKHAVTRQTLSVHLPGKGGEDVPDLRHQRIAVLWAKRHRNKLRVGHLRGNRFVIRIREVDPLHAPLVHRRLHELMRSGAPCYFGPQRFGYRLNNHLLGARLVAEDWKGILDELLGSRGMAFPEHQRERRERYDAGDFDGALAQWSSADRAEVIALRALIQRQEHSAAVRAVGTVTLRFWASAFSSAIFNRVLDARLARGALCLLEAGDLAWKHDSRACFRVTPADIEGNELAGRLERLEISPSGPIWGRDMLRPEGRAAEEEERALREFAATPAQVESCRWLEGVRRPMRCSLQDVDVEGGFDEHGPNLRVAFELPRGMYATVVLREVMRGAMLEDEGTEEETGR